MQIGLTIPLQRFLKIKFLPYGEATDRLYCWDLHVIALRGSQSLLAVHCASRYTFVVLGMTASDWERLPEVMAEGIQRSFHAAGISENAISRYLQIAGNAEITKTHGRREVAFLNRAWDDVIALDYAVDPERQEQPLLEQAVNSTLCRCAGREEKATAQEHLLAVLQPITKETAEQQG